MVQPPQYSGKAIAELSRIGTVPAMPAMPAMLAMPAHHRTCVVSTWSPILRPPGLQVTTLPCLATVLRPEYFRLGCLYLSYTIRGCCGQIGGANMSAPERRSHEDTYPDQKTGSIGCQGPYSGTIDSALPARLW
jgi:hypothetical protein